MNKQNLKEKENLAEFYTSKKLEHLHQETQFSIVIIKKETNGKRV